MYCLEFGYNTILEWIKEEKHKKWRKKILEDIMCISYKTSLLCIIFFVITSVWHTPFPEKKLVWGILFVNVGGGGLLPPSENFRRTHLISISTSNLRICSGSEVRVCVFLYFDGKALQISKEEAQRIKGKGEGNLGADTEFQPEGGRGLALSLPPPPLRPSGGEKAKIM